MENIIKLQMEVYPDLIEVMHQRYLVLRNVNTFQPVGRRVLMESTNLTERLVRKEVAFLKGKGYIDMTSKGMYTTKEGKLILERLATLIDEILGLSVLENNLKEKLKLNDIIIVSGNSDRNQWVKQEMGKVCVSFLKKRIKPNHTLAIAGGTTMAAIAEEMIPLDRIGNCLFVPTRGGVGNKLENQANTIAAKMAQKANGEYRLLHIPDPLSETSYKAMINEPTVMETLDLIKQSNIVIHGIGNALTTASHRESSKEVTKELKKNRAVSEAFGYYFNQNGEVVHQLKTIGIQMKDLVLADYVIAVAGGESKAAAIASYLQKGKTDLLITDEGAARIILENGN